jgi:dTDP-4-amino-4,6-dideoxygalactose transaminase
MIPFLKPVMPSAERYQEHINKMHETGWYSNNGEFVQRFERELQEYLQTNREVILVNNATLGLILAIKGLNIEKPILVPSFTFAATIGSVSWCSLEYDYVDIEPNYWCMDPVKAEEKLRTGRYGVIMPVHTLGLPCDIGAFEKLAKKYEVKLILDGAPAIGASYNNRRVGNFGDIEVFSLHATKCLPIGEGGFLTVKDFEVAQTIRQLKSFGFAGDRTAHLDGTNAKMPEILAAIGIEALKDLKQHMRNRYQYVDLYKKLLGDLVEFQGIRPGTKHGYQILSVLTKKEGGEVVAKLLEEGVQARQYYWPPIHMHPAYKRDVNLPITMDVANRVISLPLYSLMDEITIEVVCEKLRNILCQ